MKSPVAHQSREGFERFLEKVILILLDIGM
jgi:hypothetical protein